MTSSFSLSESDRQAILDDGWTLQIASNGPDGFPHLVAVWYVVIDGAVHFTTFRKSRKVANLESNPKLTVMVESGRQYTELRGLVIKGTAAIIDDAASTARVMAQVAEKYQAKPAGVDTTEAVLAMAARRVTIRLDPVDSYSWRF